MFVAVLSTVACASDSRVADSNSPEFTHDGWRSVPLETKAIASNPVFGRLYGMQATQRSVWIADGEGDPFLFHLSRPGYIVERAIGRRGEGPGDFKAVSDLSLRPGDSSAVWAFDLTTKRLTRVPDDREDDSRTIGPLPSNLTHAVWLSSNRIVGVGRTESNRFTFMDSLGQVTDSASGSFPGADSIPSAVRAKLALGVKVCTKPSGDRLALLYLGAGRVEIFDDRGKELSLAKVPYESSGEFARDSLSGKWVVRIPRNYYAGCTATQTEIFALFSGRRQDGFEGQAASSGRFIHVFDWNGSLRTVLTIDHDATSLTVDADGQLYLSSVDSDTVRFVQIPTSP